LLAGCACGATSISPDSAVIDASSMRDAIAETAIDALAAPADTGIDAGDAGPPTACADAPLRFAGSFCSVCALLDQELLDTIHHRNDAPSIAVDSAGRPAIAFTRAELGASGWYARYSSSGWETNAIPGEYSTGAFFFDRDAAMLVADDGASSIRVMRLDDRDWLETGLRLFGSTSTSAIAIDRGGCLYVAHGAPLGLARFHAGVWADAPLESDLAPIAPSLALASDGTAHVSWRSEGHARWRTLAGAIEELPLPEGAADGAPSAMVVIDGEPHLLVKTHCDAPCRSRLYELHRTGGTWSAIAIAADVYEGCDPERMVPTRPGERCDFVRRSFHPIAIVASSSGDRRVIYGELDQVGHYVSFCGLTEGCAWNGMPTFAGSLQMARIEDEIAIVSTTLGAAPAVAGSAVVDERGWIHIAIYEYGGGLSDTRLRYLRFGPAT
jgi:hypothetical protein